MNFKDKLNKIECKGDLPTCEKCNIISKAQEIKDYCENNICLIKNPKKGNNECPFFKYDEEGLYCELTETESLPFNWDI